MWCAARLGDGARTVKPERRLPSAFRRHCLRSRCLFFFLRLCDVIDDVQRFRPGGQAAKQTAISTVSTASHFDASHASRKSRSARQRRADFVHTLAPTYVSQRSSSPGAVAGRTSAWCSGQRRSHRRVHQLPDVPSFCCWPETRTLPNQHSSDAACSNMSHQAIP